MDPFSRPNQYGLRPPPPPPPQQSGGYGPPPGVRAPFPPQHSMSRPPPPNMSGPPPAAANNGLPPTQGQPSPAAAAAPPSGASNSGPVDTTNDKLNTLFVGAIAPGIGDAWIEKLLETCGKLRHWKRTKDASGNPKGFGFATYADPDSVLSALRVLGGEKTDGVILRAQDGSGVEKKLIVKADDQVRSYLESYTNSNQVDNSTSDDSEKYASIQKFVQSIASGQQEPAESEAADAINRELAYFRDRATQNEEQHHRQHHQQQYHHQQQQRRGSNDYNDYNRAPLGGGRGADFIKGPTEYTRNHQELMASDEEIERRRIEKHERDVENAYRQREKRFENREANKLRDYERDLKREKGEEEREVKEKEYWLERLANWDDDVEAEKGQEIYYADRSRWRKMRESVRRREAERDEEDIRRETHELEQERLRQEEEELKKKDSKYLNREALEEKIALKPKKLNFNIPIKRNTLGGADEDDEEAEKKKRRVLVPLDYGDIDNIKYNEDEEDQVVRNLSQEERATKVKELITSIPSSQVDLWAYQVKWDELDQELIETKLHPFVSKKIVELLGMEEDDLVKFVLDFIKKRKGPDELVTELEGALDEDALVFVMKFWRALIFETERKAKKL